MNKNSLRIGITLLAGLTLTAVAVFAFTHWLSPKKLPELGTVSEQPVNHSQHAMHSGQTSSTNTTAESANVTRLIAQALDANHNEKLDDDEYNQMVALWNKKTPVPGTDGLVIDQAAFFALTDFWLKGTLTISSQPASANASQAGTTDPLASQFLSECASNSNKIACYLERFQKIITESGTERALTVLEQVAAADPMALTAGHPLAHEIGRSSFAHYGDAKTAFAHCREMFDSGCYHGVLEAVLTSTPDITPAAVGNLCDAAVGAGQSSFVKFQCVHGLGHGLLMHFHEIPQALSYCDALPTTWDRESCYGGVFMENIVAVNTTNPHHPHRHQLDPNDPLSPCDQVSKKYQGSCYFLQSSAILMLNGYNFAEAFKTCEQTPREFIEICYQSMGRDVSGYTLRNTERSYELCLLGSSQYVSQCITGVAKDFVNNSARPEPGMAFCQRVEAAYKGSCYQAIGVMVASLYGDSQSRRAACAKAEENYQSVCARAAGTSP